MLEAAQPAHFRPQQDDLTEDEEDADDEHAQDHCVETGRIAEDPQQFLAQIGRQARDDREVIGDGTHARVVVNVARFDDGVQRKLRDGAG